MNVTRCGDATPISVRTRTVSSLLAGSITRARTSARNVPSPRRSRPRVVVDAGQDLPQDQRGCALGHRRRPRSARAGVAEIQGQLPGMAAFLGDLQQHGELVVGMG